MQIPDVISQLFRPRSRSTARLGDFTFSGRGGPILVLAVIAAGYYLILGFDQTLRMLLQLCAAFAVAYFLLAALARIAGADARWRLVLPVALIGAALGGIAAAAIAVAPDLSRLASWNEIESAWKIGAAFSIFFVALSLVTTAVRKREQAEHEVRRRLLEGRLQLLAARIEPHFLRNTLANLRYLVKSDAASASLMLNHLSTFLEGALQRSRDLESTLGQELEIVESYLSIMRIRLGDKLRFRIEVPEQFNSIRFPALLLQTLVENAVRHGIEPLDRPGEIAVRAESAAAAIRLSIADNGAGFESGRLQSAGVGLRNVRDRLEAFFAGRASFEIESQPTHGTVATVILPQGGT